MVLSALITFFETQFFQKIALGSVIFGTVAFIMQRGFIYYLDRRLDQHRHELDKEKVQLQNIHEEQAEVISNTHQKLKNFEQKMRSLVTPLEHGSEPPKKERAKEAADAGQEFYKYFDENRHYFPEDVCSLIDEFHEKMKGSFFSFTRRVADRDPEKLFGKAEEDYHKAWTDAWDTVDNEVAPISEEIANEFREILGTELSHDE